MVPFEPGLFLTLRSVVMRIRNVFPHLVEKYTPLAFGVLDHRKLRREYFPGIWKIFPGGR